MPNYSIAVSARDNFSTTIRKMAANTTPFRKDLEELEQELSSLSNNKYDLNLDLRKARAELKDAERAFDKTGDAMDELHVKQAMAKYDNISTNLKMVSQRANTAQRDMVKLSQTLSDPAGSKAGGGVLSTLSGLTAKLGSAGALQMAGDTAAQIANAYAGSALGADGGAIFGSMLSSAGSGAAMGAMVGGVPGAVVGGIAGAALGTVNGITQASTNKDDSFKNYVQGQYETIKDEDKTMQASGSAIAASRETTQISFNTLMGDHDVAKNYLQDVRTMANTTPFLFEDLTSMSKVLKTFKFETSDLIPTMTKIGDAGAALGMSSGDMTQVTSYLGRMKSSDKATMEYINPLVERGLDVYGYIAQAKGTSEKDAMAMLSSGSVSGSEVSSILIEAMGKQFEGAMLEQSKTMAGLQSTFQGANDEQAAAMGEGYNEERKKGITAQIAFLSGEDGEAMAEANRAVGAWKADLENQREELERTYVKEVLDGEEYKAAEASGNAAKMGELISMAKVKAQNEYNASEGAQQLLQSELSLIGAIRNDSALNKSYWDTGYKMGQEFTKGMAAASANRKSALGLDLSEDGEYYVIENIDGFQELVPKFPESKAANKQSTPNSNADTSAGGGTGGGSRGTSSPGRIDINLSMGGVTINNEMDINAFAGQLVREIKPHMAAATDGRM